MNTSATHIHALALYRELKSTRPAPAPRRDFRINNLASQADRLTLTGETDPIAQCAACERLGIAYYRRQRAGWTIPECNVWLDETTHDRLLAAEAAQRPVLYAVPVQMQQSCAIDTARDADRRDAWDALNDDAPTDREPEPRAGMTGPSDHVACPERAAALDYHMTALMARWSRA